MSRRSAHAPVPVGDTTALADANPEAYQTQSPEDLLLDAEAQEGGDEPVHNSSLTEVAAEALRTGLFPSAAQDEVPGDDRRLRAGDPDVDPLRNELSGEEMPGASAPTPDQDSVDDIGRVYGVAEEGDGALIATEELMERRDAHRWEAETLSPKI